MLERFLWFYVFTVGTYAMIQIVILFSLLAKFAGARKTAVIIIVIAAVWWALKSCII